MSVQQFKQTNQRTIILEYLKDNYNHPTVDDVFYFVKNKIPTVSKKTVYRNLQLLSEKNIIRELKIKGILKYDSVLRPHCHLICTECNQIIDKNNKELQLYANKIANNIKDFEVKYPSINFYGICKKCIGGK